MSDQPSSKQRTPTFLRRAPPEETPVHEKPEVRQFLDSYVSTGRRLVDLERALDEVNLDLDKATGRANYLEQELRRACLARDEFQIGYCELKAALAMISSVAIGSMRATSEAIESAVKSAKAKMDAAGMRDVTQPESPDALVEGIGKIAAKFGADRRPPQDDS